MHKALSSGLLASLLFTGCGSGASGGDSIVTGPQSSAEAQSSRILGVVGMLPGEKAEVQVLDAAGSPLTSALPVSSGGVFEVPLPSLPASFRISATVSGEGAGATQVWDSLYPGNWDGQSVLHVNVLTDLAAAAYDLPTELPYEQAVAQLKQSLDLPADFDIYQELPYGDDAFDPQAYRQLVAELGGFPRPGAAPGADGVDALAQAVDQQQHVGDDLRALQGKAGDTSLLAHHSEQDTKEFADLVSRSKASQIVRTDSFVVSGVKNTSTVSSTKAVERTAGRGAAEDAALGVGFGIFDSVLAVASIIQAQQLSQALAAVENYLTALANQLLADIQTLTVTVDYDAAKRQLDTYTGHVTLTATHLAAIFSANTADNTTSLQDGTVFSPSFGTLVAHIADYQAQLKGDSGALALYHKLQNPHEFYTSKTVASEQRQLVYWQNAQGTLAQEVCEGRALAAPTQSNLNLLQSDLDVVAYNLAYQRALLPPPPNSFQGFSLVAINKNIRKPLQLLLPSKESIGAATFQDMLDSASGSTVGGIKWRQATVEDIVEQLGPNNQFAPDLDKALPSLFPVAKDLSGGTQVWAFREAYYSGPWSPLVQFFFWKDSSGKYHVVQGNLGQTFYFVNATPQSGYRKAKDLSLGAFSPNMLVVGDSGQDPSYLTQAGNQTSVTLRLTNTTVGNSTLPSVQALGGGSNPLLSGSVSNLPLDSARVAWNTTDPTILRVSNLDGTMCRFTDTGKQSYRVVPGQLLFTGKPGTVSLTGTIPANGLTVPHELKASLSLNVSYGSSGFPAPEPVDVQITPRKLTVKIGQSTAQLYATLFSAVPANGAYPGQLDVLPTDITSTARWTTSSANVTVEGGLLRVRGGAPNNTVTVTAAPAAGRPSDSIQVSIPAPSPTPAPTPTPSPSPTPVPSPSPTPVPSPSPTPVPSPSPTPVPSPSPAPTIQALKLVEDWETSKGEPIVYQLFAFRSDGSVVELSDDPSVVWTASPSTRVSVNRGVASILSRPRLTRDTVEITANYRGSTARGTIVILPVL